LTEAGGSFHDRSPIVRIELQLRPQPPKGSTPWWCYWDTLLFYDDQVKTVWEQKIPISRLPSGAARVEYKGDQFGWVLVLEFLHEKAEHALKTLGLSDYRTPFCPGPCGKEVHARDDAGACPYPHYREENGVIVTRG